MKSTNTIQKVSISLFQLISTALLRFVALLFGRVQVINAPKIEKSKTYMFVSNHYSYFDVYAIFLGLPIRTIWSAAPMKFMTAERIYLSFFKPILYLGGAYPAKLTKKLNYNSVDTSIKLLESGYNVTMFPEGGIVKNKPKPARPGVIKIMNQYSGDMQIILVRLDWQGRGISRTLCVSYGTCSAASTPEEIMEQIYRLPLGG